MPSRTLDANALTAQEDWEGNNIAIACPACGKVYIVSERIHGGERICPNPACGKSRGMVKGGRKSGGTASIHW